MDGQDGEAVLKALKRARSNKTQPTLICCKTIIGFGAPHKQGTKATHGEALGVAEVAAARVSLGWNSPPFVIPPDIAAGWDQRDAGQRAERAWRRRFSRYHKEHPQLATEFERRMKGALPAEWPAACERALAAALAVAVPQATRASSQVVLNAIGPTMPELLGGSADLTGSVNTFRKDSRNITPEDFSGNYLSYGVREFAMTAMMNGLSLHGGFIPYAGTFLVFSDYARNAVRLAALMHLRNVLVYTHDSIGLGEDGPTHQAVEHLASLRAMPNLSLWRPCDAVETAVAWRIAIENNNRPTALVLSRQAMPQQVRSPEQQLDIVRGGYILHDADGGSNAAPLDAILIATGSEVGVAMDAAATLTARGRRVRVVSMPCSDAFERQDAAYRERVLPAAVTSRVAIEAGATQSWWRYVGSRGRVVGLDGFGASGKAADLYKHFGITADKAVQHVESLLAAR